MLITTPYVNFFPYVASYTSGSTSTTSITTPSGVKAGDLLLLLVGNGGQMGSAGWSNVVTYNGVDFNCIAKVATGTEGATITTTGTSCDRWFCLRIVNHQSGVANVAVAHNNGSGTTLTAPAVAPGWGGDNQLIVTIADHDQGPTYTTRPTGFTSLGTVTNFWSFGCDWGWMTGSSLTPGGYVASNSSTWWNYVFAIH